MKILILIYIVELLKYWLSFHICFHAKIKKIWAAFIGLIIYIFLINSGKIDNNELHLVMFAIVIMVLLISVESNYKILHILMLILVITTLDGLSGTPIEYMLNNYKGEMNIADLEYLSSSFISFFLIIMVFVIRKRSNLFNNDKAMKFIRKRMYIVVAIMAFFLLLTIAGLNNEKAYILNETFAMFVTIVSTISLFSVGLLGVFMIYIKNTNEKMEQLIESGRKLKDMHIKYYEALLEKEEDTRRYRHDLNNHLICLSELARSEKPDLVIDYIERMQSQMNNIQKKCYIVGNEVIDAILNYYLPKLSEEVKISVKGRFASDLKVNNVDLCTIFSNLLQNAVEAVTIESENAKKLQVVIHQGKDYSQIEIVNSVSTFYEEEKGGLKGGFLKTQKADKRNHGIGLHNVKETIERNEGVLDIKKENSTFSVNVILKNEIRVNRPLTELTDR